MTAHSIEVDVHGLLTIFPKISLSLSIYRQMAGRLGWSQHSGPSYLARAFTTWQKAAYRTAHQGSITDPSPYNDFDILSSSIS